MTGEPWDQLPLFDNAPYAVEQPPGEVELDDIAEWAAAAAKEARDAAKHDAVAKAKLHLNSDAARRETEQQKWRRLQLKKSRKLPPRRPIAERTRLRILQADSYRCTCGHTGDDVSLHMGHILAREDAWDLVEVSGDTEPWRLESEPENLFSHCAKCNLAQGPQSLSLDDAWRVFLHVARPWARPSVVRSILEWCQKAEEWRPCR